jgi:hypothetical protein
MRIEADDMSWPERIRGLKSLARLARFMGGEMWTTYGRPDGQQAA